MNHLARFVLILALAACSRSALAQRTSVPTAFTYQGVMHDNGAPYTGLAKAQFRLFTTQTAGQQVATTGVLTNIDVADGLFTVEIDFGSAGLAHQADWLEIAIAKQSDPAPVTLAPRQRLGSAPLAAQVAGAIQSDGNNVLRAGSFAAVFNPISGFPPTLQTSSVWQSFTTDGKSGTLYDIILPIIPSNEFTIDDAVVTLYEGEGTGGQVIATLSPYTINFTSSILHIGFTPNPVLLSTSTYTIEIQCFGSDFIKITPNDSNSYPNGRASVSPDHDLVCYVYLDSSESPLVWIDPADSLRVDSSIGIRTEGGPTAAITIDASDLNPDEFNIDTYNDDIVVGGNSGVLGLYGKAFSNPARLTLSSYETATGLTDKWSAIHTGPNGNSALELTFGSSNLPHLNPTVALFNAAGDFALGTETPLAPLHVATSSLVIDAGAISGESAMVTGTDSVFTLYSRNIGAWGSVISLKDVNSGGTLIDNWSIARGASPGSALNFTYGTNPNGPSNPTLMQLSSASGTLSIGNTSTSSGRLIVTQNADTSSGGVAIFDADNSQSMRLWIDATGTRRIDAGASGTQPIEINAGGGPVYIDNPIVPSSASRKADIQTLTDALNTLLGLRGVSYTKKINGESTIGFIAEEMATVLPEVVQFDDEGKPTGIAYQKLTALTVEAIKQQQSELESLRSTLDQVLNRLEQLESAEQ